MARSMTPAEKQFAKSNWPNINPDGLIVTGEATDVYNCLAWTLGITNSWVWPWSRPPVSKQQFDVLYRSHGFDPAAAGTIAAFGNSGNQMTHGAISGAGHGPRWESKAGEWLRFQHGLGEMEGGNYGKTQGYYTKRPAAPAVQPAIRKPKGKPMKLSKDEAALLGRLATGVDKTLAKQFDSAYQAWKADWANPAVLLSSAPSDRRYSIHYLRLLQMGPAILPLLMQKMQDNAGDFFALQAVDQLLPLSEIVSYDLDDPAVLLGEQGRAQATVRRWLAYKA